MKSTASTTTFCPGGSRGTSSRTGTGSTAGTFAGRDAWTSSPSRIPRSTGILPRSCTEVILHHNSTASVLFSQLIEWLKVLYNLTPRAIMFTALLMSYTNSTNNIFIFTNNYDIDTMHDMTWSDGIWWLAYMMGKRYDPIIYFIAIHVWWDKREQYSLLTFIIWRYIFFDTAQQDMHALLDR